MVGNICRFRNLFQFNEIKYFPLNPLFYGFHCLNIYCLLNCSVIVRLLSCCRYQWNGQPLFISELSAELPSSCCHCGGLLVFEFQLMPGLVNKLKVLGTNSKLWIVLLNS